MKNPIGFKTLLMTTALTALSQFAWATQPIGGSNSGGGDECERQIQMIGNNISSWISQGGAQGLQLPPGVTPIKYAKDMQEQIKKARISCVGRGDRGYPVQIWDAKTRKNVPKTCRFDLSSQASKITCDYEKFNSLNEPKQYVLVHHEYAGLAKIEKPDGADSKYEVSDQITAYLENQTVTKLVVKPTSKAECIARMTANNTEAAICSKFVNVDLNTILDVFTKFGPLTTQSGELEKSFVKIERLSPSQARLSLIPNNDYHFQAQILELARPEERKERLKPFLQDKLVLNLTAVGAATQVSVDASSIVGGYSVLTNLAMCDLKKVSAKNCAYFQFEVSKNLDTDVTLWLGNPTYDIEEDNVDASLDMHFRNPRYWSLESTYGNGNDSDDVDSVMVGFDLSGSPTYSTRRGAHHRN